ncbi:MULTISPECIES: transposase [Enterococcus]|uniref:transposase n=1 Tax=Enterococcus TaxID=1350 RepID=UPI0011646435|nr:transposase [Enterococcus avium]HAP3021568.1 IS110 family transposase [Enterococcus faecalis]AYQ24094.1 hypothetical protein AUF16_05310 [Enterococcus avium]HBI1562966.1 transposase [Enterococcus faecalis]HBI1566083.1 transposase [Enterococcus faecalis]HBI1717732.1 transposase [Enterococcus faecalis]
MLDSKIKILEAEIQKIVSKQENYRTTITGIGDITATVLMTEVEDIRRFERPHQLLAFARLMSLFISLKILQEPKKTF